MVAHHPKASIYSHYLVGLGQDEMTREFSAMDHAGNVVKLSDLKGQKVWLWFFSSPGGNN